MHQIFNWKIYLFLCHENNKFRNILLKLLFHKTRFVDFGCNQNKKYHLLLRSILFFLGDHSKWRLKKHGHGFGQTLFFVFLLFKCFSNAFHMINYNLRVNRKVINKQNTGLTVIFHENKVRSCFSFSSWFIYLFIHFKNRLTVANV